VDEDAVGLAVQAAVVPAAEDRPAASRRPIVQKSSSHKESWLEKQRIGACCAGTLLCFREPFLDSFAPTARNPERLTSWVPNPSREEMIMFLASRCSVWALLLAMPALAVLAEPAFAQRGCMRQSQGQSSLRTQSYLPQQAYLSAQGYAYPQLGYQASANAALLQQYALQSQLNALAQNAYLGQLYAAQVPNAQVNAAQLAGAQVDPQGMVDLLRLQLDDLKEYIADQKANGQLTTTQLRNLRQQEKTLTRQVRAAEKRAASQKTPARTSTQIGGG
jgi:hypothetical protein